MTRYALALLLCLPLGCITNVYPDPQPDPAPIVDPLPVPPVETKPGILGEDSVAPGAPIWLTANVEDGSVMEWKVISPKGLAFKATEGGKEFSSAAPVDATEVEVLLGVAREVPALIESPLELKFVTKTVQVGKSPNPPPGPDPPGPTPEPQPTPEKVGYALVVYEKDELASNTNVAVLMQSDFIQKMVAAGGKARFYEDDHPGAGQQYREELVKRGIEGPGILHYTLDGKNVTDAFSVKGMEKAAILARLGVK